MVWVMLAGFWITCIIPSLYLEWRKIDGYYMNPQDKAEIFLCAIFAIVVSGPFWLLVVVLGYISKSIFNCTRSGLQRLFE